VRSEAVFDRAGLLTETAAGLVKDASGNVVSAQYYSLYAGQDVEMAERTAYEYYADGTPKQTTLPGGVHQTVYVDPLSRTQWTVTDGVSDGAHTVDSDGAITHFNLDGTEVTKSVVDVLNRSTLQWNLLTSARVESSYSPGGSLPSQVTRRTGPVGAQITAVSTLDAFGNLVLQEAPGQYLESRYDELGNLVETTDVAAGALAYAYQTNAAGDPIQVTESRRTPLVSRVQVTALTTTYSLDEHGRVRKIVDPLNDGVASSTNPADESLAVPQTIEYQFDTLLKLMKVTTTSRTGIVTYQWFDAAGRLARDQNQYGGVTTYGYDPAGQLVEEKFTPRTGDTLPERRTTLDYDALGRVRATIRHGAQPGFTATDYFVNGAAGSDGWNVVEFITLRGTDPKAFNDANKKNLATRTRLDSLGRPYYIQAPDPGAPPTQPNPPNDTPTTLITYSYLPEQLASVITTRLSVAENVGAAGAAIDPNYP
jgi:YD repeat-containing protein